MSFLTDIWRQLKERRLWPVALLLVAAIVAVPLVLAKDPEPAVDAATPPASAGDAGADDLSDEPIVTAEAVSVRAKGRVVIGKQRDIFASTAKEPKQEKQDDKDAKKSSSGDKGDDGKDASPAPEPPASSGGGGSAPAPAPVDPGTQPAPKPKPKTYPQYSLKVRFSGGDAGATGILTRRSALPSDENPLLVYLGLLDDHKTAVFLLDSTVTAVGDGACHPSPESCETVRMQKGDTMFFDVHGDDGSVGEQFELDLLAINKKQTTDAAKAARSSKLARVARSSRVERRGSGLGGTSLLPIR